MYNCDFMHFAELNDQNYISSGEKRVLKPKYTALFPQNF